MEVQCQVLQNQQKQTIPLEDITQVQEEVEQSIIMQMEHQQEIMI